MKRRLLERYFPKDQENVENLTSFRMDGIMREHCLDFDLCFGADGDIGIEGTLDFYAGMFVDGLLGQAHEKLIVEPSVGQRSVRRFEGAGVMDEYKTASDSYQAELDPIGRMITFLLNDRKKHLTVKKIEGPHSPGYFSPILTFTHERPDPRLYKKVHSALIQTEGELREELGIKAA